MTNIDKPKTGGKESVSYFGNMFFTCPNDGQLILYEKVRIFYEKNCKDVDGFRIKFQGN